MQLMMPLTYVGELLRESYKAFADLKQFVHILDTPPIYSQAPGVLKKFSAGTVEFRNVVFSYDKIKSLFQDLSFTFSGGTKTIVVGPSGCGKSTLVKLLLRLYEPDGGEIFIDGISIFDYDIQTLREQIAIVPQDTVMFNESIAYNIACGDPKANFDAIVEAAKAANLHDHILSLQANYQTVVGERGIKLSGGERQRLALARAFIKQPKIMVFDEATNALDPQTRSDIEAFIDEHAKGKTVITIAHQIDNTIESATLLKIG